jgi:serine protease Do
MELKGRWPGYGTLLLGLIAVLALVFTACTTPPAPTTTSSSTSPAPTTTPAPNSDTPVDFVAAVQKVMPSVVEIEITYGPQGAPGDPRTHAAAGSGWILREDGLIVTNNHVVDSAQTITVILADGTRYTSTAVQGNAGKDLAVVKIAAQNLPAAVAGDSSQLKMAQPVAAIGNALNMGIRVTVGVVSQLNVPVSYDGVSLNGLIETDASINPGNSGGVLINILGEVVGIPSAGLQDPNLDVEDFGYAISINEALPVINNLIAQMP